MNDRPHAARLPAARRRQQLLEVALEVFGEQGFHPASMNDVAEAAGVTKPVLYQHFRSKRDLYREVLTDVGAQLLDAITKATTAATSPHEQVELGFIAYFRWVDGERGRLPRALRRRHAARRGVRRAGCQGRGRHRRGHRHAHRRRGAQDGPQRRQLAHGLVGLAEGTSRLWMAEGAEQPAEDLARLVADLAWRGLRGIRGA